MMAGSSTLVIMKLLIVLACVVALIAPVAVAEIAAGSCPPYSNVHHFNLTLYMGHWYEEERYETPFEEDMVCCTARYVQTSDTTFHVNNTGDIHGKFIYVEGSGATTNMTGQVNITIPGYGSPPVANVLATDYYTYASVYACRNLESGLREEYAWVLSRHPYMDAEFTLEARDAFSRFGIDVGRLSKTPQGGHCTY